MVVDFDKSSATIKKRGAGFKETVRVNTSLDHNIRAVCFDLDGVLVDAADWHRDAFNQALIHYRYDALDQDDHLKNFNGLSTYKKLEMLYKRGVFPDSQKFIETEDSSIKNLWSEVYKRKQKYTIQIIEEFCKPIPRVQATVELAGFIFADKIAVVTNCSRYTAELMLEKSGLLHLFEFLICNEDVNGNIKPSPLPYLTAVNRFGLRPNQVLAIDDTGKGIMSAIDAFCRTWFLKKFKHLTEDHLVNVLDNYRINI